MRFAFIEGREGRVFDCAELCGAGRVARWLLCVAWAAARGAGGGESAAGTRGGRDPRGESATIRESPCPPRAPHAPMLRRSQTRRPPDACLGLARAYATTFPHDDRLAAHAADRPQRPRPPLRDAGSRHRLGDRPHVSLDARGLAVPRGDSGSLLAADRRLGSERTDHAPARARRAHDGPNASSPGPRPRPSLGSRESVCQSVLPTPARGARDRLQHEPARRLLGQRRRRELLLDAQARTRL